MRFTEMDPTIDQISTISYRQDDTRVWVECLLNFSLIVEQVNDGCLYFYSTIREVLISVRRSLSSINILRNLWWSTWQFSARDRFSIYHQAIFHYGSAEIQGLPGQ